MGFGAEVRHALERRADHLIERGLAQRRGAQLVFVRDLLKTLHTEEFQHVGDQLRQEFNRPLRVPTRGERVAGSLGNITMLEVVADTSPRSLEVSLSDEHQLLRVLWGNIQTDARHASDSPLK